MLGWTYTAVDEALGFGVSILTMLMVAGVAAWFARSVVESVAEMSRYVRRSNHEALLRENERLRGALAEAREKNDYLRKLYRTPLLGVEDRARDAA